MRYFAISTGLQISALLSAAVLACWLCFTTVSVAFHGAALAEKDQEVDEMQREAERIVAEARANEVSARAFVESQMQTFDETAVEFEVRHERLRRLLDFVERISGDEIMPSPTGTDGSVLMAATPADPAPREARDIPVSVAALSDSPEDQITYLMSEQDVALARAENATEAQLENLRAILRLTDLDIEEVVASERDSEEQGGPFLPISESSFAPGIELDGQFEGRINRIAARLLEVNELEEFAAQGPFGPPISVPHRRTSGFGLRRDPFNGRPTQHRGLDYGAYRRAPIVATGPGEVIYAGWRGGYGRTVEIDHGYGFVTRYAHLHEIAVRRGDTVERGQQIGGMGSTGRSTATHLHYEIWYNGSAIDPDRLLRAGRYVQ